MTHQATGTLMLKIREDVWIEKILSTLPDRCNLKKKMYGQF